MASIFSHLGRSASKKAGPDDEDDIDEAEKTRRAKKAKKAKGEDGDDEEDDEEENGKKDKKDQDDAKASAARGRERARVRAIVTSGPGLANPVVAAHMALDTDMPRSKAIAAIGALNVATGARDEEEALAEFRAKPEVSMANAILAAGAKARGEESRTIVPPGRRERMGLRETERPTPPPRNMADRIIEAGRKARGEA